METSNPALRLSVQDGLATVTLTQPERGNPIDGPFTAAFKQMALALWNIEGLRAVLLRAEGANFSYGGDIKSLHAERRQLAPHISVRTSDVHMGLQRLWQLPVPIVAQVQGWAMGGAVGIVAGCDVVMASPSTRHARRASSWPRSVSSRGERAIRA